MLNRKLLVVLSISMASCVSQDLDYEMGSSVAEMIDSQVYDRAALTTPPKGIVGGMDGDVAERVIDLHRQPAAKSATVAENTEFEMEGD